MKRNVIPCECHSGADKTYHLTDAILLYREGGRNGDVVFASAHEVSMGNKKKPEIQAGVAVAKSGLVEMFKTLTPEDYVRPALFDSRILAIGSNHLAWFCPPKRREVWFKCDKIGEGEVHGLADHPGLVFIVMGDKWYVYAVKSKSRPSASTPLYESYFFNVWDGGGICTGNIDLPQGPAKFNPAAWEDAFFRSYFTHTNGNAKRLTKHPKGIFGLWKDLLKGKPFPKDSLVPMKKRLGQVFDELVKRNVEGG